MNETAGLRPAASRGSLPPAADDLPIVRAIALEEVSLSEAVRLSGITQESLRFAIHAERLPARFGRQTPVRGAGRTGNPMRWMIRRVDLTEYVCSLPRCRYPGCDRPGRGPTGCCAGPHALGVLTAGRPRPPEVGQKVSAAMRGVARGPHSPEHKAKLTAGLRRFYASPESERVRNSYSTRMHDPRRQFAAQMGRWGHRSVEAAKRAASRFQAAVERDLRRRRGGAPRKDDLRDRWRAMYDGPDAELDSIVAAGLSRLRTLALLDWQRHPEDWPRERWPASRGDPDGLDPLLLPGAADRVRKGLQSRRK